MPQSESFDSSINDAQAMPVQPLDPHLFDWSRCEDFARQADERYAHFLSLSEGCAVWQRVRVAEVFRDGCRDRQQSLWWQVGALAKSMAYFTDAPTYLEPWYGIGTTASLFGGQYEWPADQAPVVSPLWHSLQDVPEPLVALPEAAPTILQDTLEMIGYFLEESRGQAPISWCDIQNPLNVATELVDTNAFMTGLFEDPQKVSRILSVITDQIIAFTHKQTALLGKTLARPGHGFASSYSGTGIGMSTDNLVMISPSLYEKFCVANETRIGAAFGGTAIHSCGNWARWIGAVKKNDNLVMVDGAFSPQTDPNYNECEAFRSAFVNTGVIVHARMVGSPETVLEHTRRLWAPGMKLIVVTYVQDPQAQRQLYHDIHSICS